MAGTAVSSLVIPDVLVDVAHQIAEVVSKMLEKDRLPGVYIRVRVSSNIDKRH